MTAESGTLGARPGILVVDDDQGIRENVAELLGLEEYRVFTAGDAEEAMGRFSADDIDLLLTDYQMPGKNGVELIEAARQIKPDLPALLITAFPYVYEQLDPERRRGIEFLRKPFAAEELLQAVGDILAKRAA